MTKSKIDLSAAPNAAFQIDGGEVRILNDDEILSTILDPEDIHQLT